MPNARKDKSFEFALRILKRCQFLMAEKKNLFLCKQLLRNSISVGAMTMEIHLNNFITMVLKISSSSKALSLP